MIHARGRGGGEGRWVGGRKRVEVRGRKCVCVSLFFDDLSLSTALARSLVAKA